MQFRFPMKDWLDFDKDHLQRAARAWRLMVAGGVLLVTLWVMFRVNHSTGNRIPANHPLGFSRWQIAPIFDESADALTLPGDSRSHGLRWQWVAAGALLGTLTFRRLRRKNRI